MLKQSLEATKQLFSSRFGAKPTNEGVHPIQFSDLDKAGTNGQIIQFDWAGDKFIGGYGDTEVLNVDYWTLRQRSTELFTKNLYARGIIRRFVTNVISTGIELEAQPDGNILPLEDDPLDTWSENVESLWNAWASQPGLCDLRGLKTFGKIQAEAYREAIVSGDVLVVCDVDPKTALPKVQIFSGNKVSDPLNPETPIPADAVIKYGVEMDLVGSHVAFWVEQPNGKHKRIPAFGSRSGRRTAWLVYGSDKLVDEVRGQPLLSLVLQSLKEIDRYRDSATRKAVINSYLAMFIQRDLPNQLPTMPSARMAVSSETIQTDKTDPKQLRVQKMMPGISLDGLAAGEKPVLLGGQGTDVNFGEFEATIVQALAWCLECPPEILLMSFQKNYSASQAALHEYRIVLACKRSEWGIEFNQPIYEQFLVLQTLKGKISAPGFLDAWRDMAGQWDIFSAWVRADWFGTIKPATDILKTVRAYQALIDGGFITYAQATRELTGKKWRVVIKTLKKERQLYTEVFGVSPDQQGQGSGQAGAFLRLVSAFSDDLSDKIVQEMKTA